MSARLEKIPVTLLTGFLGSGKTTLLNCILGLQDFADTAVIVNEVGEIGLDHALVRAGKDNIRLLESGCLCCAVEGTLTETMMDLWSLRHRGDIPAFRRVIIETSGLAEPGPIAGSLIQDRFLASHFALGRILVTIDALDGIRQLASFHEAVEQLAIADAVILTKTDLVHGDVADLTQAIRRVNATAPITRASLGAINPLVLAGSSGFRLETPASSHHGHSAFVCRAAYVDDPVSWSGVAAFADLCRRTYGPELLRCKGLLRIDGEDGAVLLQGVNGAFSTTRLERWPDSDSRSRVVCIFRGEPDRFESMLTLLHTEAGTMPPASLDELEQGSMACTLIR